MNISKYLFFLAPLFLVSLNGYSQIENTDFKPSGKVTVTSYFDYSTGLNSNSNEYGFDLTRALIGYKYKFHPKLEAVVSIDGTAGRSVDDDVKVYLRNAYVSWTEGNFKLKVGLTGLTQFNLQQSIWGHRYALKSQQDLIGMGESVDLGIVASYNFNDAISADFSLTNGEGYKVIRKDKSTRYGLGITYKPFKNFVLRVFGDIYTKDKDKFDQEAIGTPIRNQFTYSFFAGYKNDLLSAGVEFNKQLHNGYVKGNHLSAASVYSTVNIDSKWNIYARYDYSGATNDIDSQYAWYDDYQGIIAGIEYRPIKYLRFSPNFRNYNYKRHSSEQYIFISGEFTF